MQEQEIAALEAAVNDAMVAGVELGSSQAPAIQSLISAYREQGKRIERAEGALKRAGFEDLGGAEWKPPIGPAPRFIEVGNEAARAAALEEAAKVCEGIATGTTGMYLTACRGCAKDIRALATTASTGAEQKPQDQAHVMPPVAAPVSQHDSSVKVLRAALERIARWHGEFPAPDSKWDDGTPMSYGAAYGSNGERDYMRQVALDALAAAPSAKQEPSDPWANLMRRAIDVVEGLSGMDNLPGAMPARAFKLRRAIEAVESLAAPSASASPTVGGAVPVAQRQDQGIILTPKQRGAIETAITYLRADGHRTTVATLESIIDPTIQQGTEQTNGEKA